MQFTAAHSIEQKLNQTIAQWQHWQCETPITQAPVIDRALSTGKSNHSFLTQGPQQCVIRIDGENPQKYGLRRSVEWRCLQTAHLAGIAPAPVYFNPELGSLVCSYLKPDLSQPATTSHDSDEELAATGNLLRQVHRLPGRSQRLDLAKRIGHYVQQMQIAPATKHQAAILQWQSKISGALNALDDLKTKPVLCHNDLLRENRISHEGILYAIDWEYAAMGSKLYDLAVVIEGDRLSERAAEKLIHAYLQSKPSAADLKELEHYRLIYCYVEALWYCLHTDITTDAIWYEEKLHALNTKLENVKNA